MMVKWRHGALTAVLLMAALHGCNCEKGCAGDAPSKAPSAGAQPVARPRATNGPHELGLKAVTIKSEWRTCTDDTQCVHMPGDCCGCHAGGTDVAVNSAHIEAVATSRQAECGEIMCAMVMSNDMSCRKDARCVSGQCTLVMGEGKEQPRVAPRNVPRLSPEELGIIPAKPVRKQDAPAQ